jgi:hypothetical protein
MWLWHGSNSATTPEERTMRYCPPYAAAKKTGHLKIDKQGKSPLDAKNKRKRGDVNTGKAGGKRRSLDQWMFVLVRFSNGVLIF